MIDNSEEANGLTIVTPNFNSSGFLEKLLLSIAKNRDDSIPLEVLIIDDSDPVEAERTRVLCQKYNARYLWCQGNVSRKRNYGVENAKHDIILFTDSDCEISANTIPEHSKLSSTGDGIGAMLGLVEFSGPINWVWRIVERTGLIGSFAFAKRMPFAPWGITANLSVKRRVFQEVGGFDETFLEAPGGEDVDIGLRINDTGYKIITNTQALIYHTRLTWNRLGKMFRRSFAYGRAHYHVIKKHKNRSDYEFPRLVSTFLIVGLALLLRLVISFSWYTLAGFLIYPLVVLIFQFILSKRALELTLKEFPRQMAAYVLDLAFETGLIAESFRHYDLSGLWIKIIYSDVQLIKERPQKIIQTWSLLLGLVALLILLSVEM